MIRIPQQMAHYSREELRSNIEEKKEHTVISWGIGIAALGVATAIFYGQIQRPPEPTPIQPAQDAYVRMIADGGSTEDLSTMYEGLVALRVATGMNSSPLEIIVQEKLLTDDVDMRTYLAKQIYHEFELHNSHWSDKASGYTVAGIMGGMGIAFMGFGIVSYRRSYKMKLLLDHIDSMSGKNDPVS